MEKRKNPEKDLRKQSGLFFNIGLLSALMLSVCAFEYRTEKFEPPVVNLEGSSEQLMNVKITRIDPPPPPPKPIHVNPVEAEPDELEPDIPVPDIDLSVIDIPGPESIDQPVEKVEDTPFIFVEKMPEPEDGLEGLYRFINDRLKYPALARRLNVEGIVYLSFVVDEKGDMVDLAIAKGIGAGCDEEVLRIFQNESPKWQPGKQRGVPVKVRQMIPIKFILN